MTRTFAIRQIAGAYQGGEVLDGEFEPMTGRYQQRAGAVRELREKLAEYGVTIAAREITTL